MLQENNFQIEKFDSEVLREYDIRGIVDKNITENTGAILFVHLFGELKDITKIKDTQICDDIFGSDHCPVSLELDL